MKYDELKNGTIIMAYARILEDPSTWWGAWTSPNGGVYGATDIKQGTLDKIIKNKIYTIEKYNGNVVTLKIKK